jgi:uncharacterized protein YecT (DUF1311 family)
MRATLLALLLTATFTAAQTSPSSPQGPPPSPPQNVPNSPQLAYQAAENSYLAQADAFRAAAKAAYDAEGTHEAAFICPNVANPSEMNDCVAHENAVTTSNYQAFTAALRSLLALPEPPEPGLTNPVQGVSGPQATAAFDAAESAWQAYTKAECSAERVGTTVDLSDGECYIRQSRARLRELAEVYRNDLRLG